MVLLEPARLPTPSNTLPCFLPLAFCLLDGKTIGHYRQVFQVLKRKVRESSGHHFRPSRLICDFELAIISASETELTTARVTGCYFHFCQSLWRHVQELGLSTLYRENLRVQNCIRQLMSLGYLPLAVVRQNFLQFCRSRRTETLASVSRSSNICRVGYIQRTYFDGPFLPVLWYVNTRNVDTRTNNHVEGTILIK